MTTRTSQPVKPRVARRIRRVAHALCLAATPTFGIMAVISAFAIDGMPGMARMYLLMSVFHAPPWLKPMQHLANPFTTRPTPSA